MRNSKQAKIKKIIALLAKLPYFTLEDVLPLEKDKTYLKICFSRYQKTGKLFRLKKGMYVSKDYVDETQRNNLFGSYSEFLANSLYSSSYLSLDYVLYQHNLLTELPVNFTSVCQNKTASFSNQFGSFLYHKIKDKLFCGYLVVKEGDFIILKATKAKALFDFLYLRKNLLVNQKAVEELRLNLEDFAKNDKAEFKKYIDLEGSKSLRNAAQILFKGFTS